MERLFLLQNRSFNVLMYLPGVTNISEATFNMLGQRSRSIGKEVDGVSAKMPVQGTPVGDYQALLVPFFFFGWQRQNERDGFSIR